MNPLRVLHVVPHLDRVGGYERQAACLAREQFRQGAVTPILLTHEAPGRPFFERTEEGEIHRLAKGWHRHSPAGWWRQHGDEIDLVHAHAFHKLTGQVVALAHKAGVPALVKVATGEDVSMFTEPARWDDVLDGAEDVRRGLRWQIMVRMAFHRLRRAGLFVALNDAIAAELRQRGLPYARLPNGVDVERFRPPTLDEVWSTRRALGVPGDAFVVAYAGRLASRKDVETLVAAFARLAVSRATDHGAAALASGAPAAALPERSLGDGLHLLLAGEGPRRPHLEAALGRAGLRGRVSLLGALDDVWPVYAAADVVVQPSRREGQSNTMLEAWACGRPTILSDVPGHRDAAEDAALGSGRLPALFVAPGDSAALAARLEELLDDAERRVALGRDARRAAEEHHDVVRVAELYEQIYLRLLMAGSILDEPPPGP